MTDSPDLPVPAGKRVVEPAVYPTFMDEGVGQPGPPSGGLKRHAATVLRYKWIVLAVTLLGSALGFYASRNATPSYTAVVTLWFEAPSDPDRGPIQAEGLLENAGWSQLMRTPAVLDSVVLAERLYVSYAARDQDVLGSFRVTNPYQPGSYVLKVDASGNSVELRTKNGLVIERTTPGSAIGAAAGFAWQPPAEALAADRTVNFTVHPTSEAAIALSNALETDMAMNSSFMSVTYTGRDPSRAARVLNTLADRYVKVAAELKSAKLFLVRDILASQRQYAEDNLRTAEFAQQNFGVQTITLPSNRSTPIAPGLESTRETVISSFFDMRVTRENLQRERDAILRIIGNGVDSLSVDALSVLPSVRAAPELSQALTQLAENRGQLRGLLLQYTTEYPPVRDLMASIRESQTVVIPRLARRLAADLESQAQVLETTINSASAELREIPPRAIEEARLARAVTSAENMYNDLSNRYESARLAAETSVPDVQIQARATAPATPSSDPRMTLLLGGVAGGLAAGILLAIMLGRFDPRLQYAEQVTQDLRLGIVGAIPDLPTSRRKLAATDSNARVIEAFRGIRHNLMHAYGLGRPMILTVTSPGPGDGKTFITSNLALAFADLGLKTLIIDGDTRRGELHRLLNTHRKPGLTDYLAGDCEVEDIICSTAYPLVNLIPGGTRRANAPELLASMRLGDMLANIRSRYQVILIDSPPLGAGVDPLILGSLSGNLVLVMRTGRTDRALAEAKLQMLDRLPIRLLGAVLNGFESHLAYQYYSYIPGYEARDEESGGSNGNLLQPV
ncbi:MAG TPA: polysaccharide biosynthesis tyrosine autokinase [Longimicrobiales bacterium]